MKNLVIYFILIFSFNCNNEFDTEQKYSELSDKYNRNQASLDFLTNDFLKSKLIFIVKNFTESKDLVFKFYGINDNIFEIIVPKKVENLAPDYLEKHFSIISTKDTNVNSFDDFLTKYSIEKNHLGDIMIIMKDLEIAELSKYPENIVRIKFYTLFGLIRSDKKINKNSIPLKLIELKEINNSWYFYREAFM